MDYAPYVLFRENNSIHRTQYVARDPETNRLVPSLELGSALRFETAALGYAFGTENNLQWWRVGKR